MIKNERRCFYMSRRLEGDPQGVCPEPRHPRGSFDQAVPRYGSRINWSEEGEGAEGDVFHAQGVISGDESRPYSEWLESLDPHESKAYEQKLLDRAIAYGGSGD
jgi:hypothetical protein